MRRKFANWQLWTVPPVVLVLLLATELAALAVPVAIATPISATDFWLAALLASLSIGYSIDRLTSEAARSALIAQRGALSSNLLATWLLPAAILLPVRLSCAVVVVAMVCEWPVKNVAGTAQLYRHVYSSACALIAVEATGGFMANPWQLPVRIAVAVLCYAVVDYAAVAIAVGLSTGFSSLRFMLAPRVHLTELLTITVGLAAVLLRYAHIPLIWLTLPSSFSGWPCARRSARPTGPKAGRCRRRCGRR